MFINPATFLKINYIQIAIGYLTKQCRKDTNFKIKLTMGILTQNLHYIIKTYTFLLFSRNGVEWTFHMQ